MKGAISRRKFGAALPYQNFIEAELATRGLEFSVDALYHDGSRHKDALWIETEKKDSPSDRDYRPSGVSVGPAMMIVGDRSAAYLFDKVALAQALYGRPTIEDRRRTSRGYRMSVEEAERCCLKKFSF
jgi:hypothetical protein